MPERPRRRHYTTEYKQRILAEADRATKPGEIGALLRPLAICAMALMVASLLHREARKGGLRPRL